MSHAAIVLCGGRSSRMGRAKAWLPWFGRTMIEHVVERLRPCVREVVVVTSEDLDLPPLDARVVRDREPERGPLAGLREGLAAIESDWAFVTGTDAPFVDARYVEALFAEGRACAPRDDGHVQVLSAVYPASARSAAERMLEAGKARPLSLLESCDPLIFEAKELVRAGEPAPWHGFNTPESYLETVRAVDPSASAVVELLGRAALRVDESEKELAVGTLGELLAAWPEDLGLIEGDRVAKSHLVSLGGRDLVRDLAVPIGPGERVNVLDALAGG